MGQSAVGVRAGRVAEMLLQIRQHRGPNLGIDWRGCVVIEVDWRHVSIA